jgi:hypothetical protein
MKARLLLLLVCIPASVFADTISIPYHQMRTILVPGATAAFAINSDYVQASAQGGVVTLFGESPGSTTVVVVTPSGVQSLQVHVPVPPPVYPPGFEMPLSANNLNESGSYEVRYVSNPEQVQNNLDFVQRQGDRTTHFFLEDANVLSSVPGVSTVGFPLAFYEISTPHKTVTFLDQYATVSPLTVYDTLLRGIHLRDGAWFFHYGYTSLSVFQNLFLPTGRQPAVGGGYKFSLSSHAQLTPELFYFGNSSHGPGLAHPGAIGSLLFEDKASDQLTYSAELGLSHGGGGSGHVSYITPQTNLVADAHYESRDFATLVTNNLHGLYSNANGFHKFNPKLRADFFFTGNRYEFPQLTETNVASNLSLDYQINKQWSALGGGGYALFNTLHSTQPAVRSLNLPAEVNYSISHFGNDFLYQYSVNGGQNRGGNELRESVHASWGHFYWGGFVDRQTEAPSLSFLFQEIPGLALALEELGITATTPQQIAQLLQNDAGLISLGFIQGATVNLSPLRVQAGGTLSWLQGASHQQLSLDFLYSSLQRITSSTQTAIQGVSFSRKLTPTNTLWVSCTLFRTREPGSVSSYQPQVEVSLRHQFFSVPRFVIPSQHGSISGVVFKDERGEGEFHSDMAGLGGVDITLDGVQHTRTNSLGFYGFSHVPYGSHTVEAHFESSRPFFYTTPSQVTVAVNSTVNFGVGYSLTSIFGSVLSDAGTGIEGIQVQVSGQGKVYRAISSMDGSFRLAGLAPGEYVVKATPESFPPGYALADVGAQTAVTALDSPARVTFTVRAYRSISGYAAVYDRSALRQVPVPGLTVTLKGTSFTNKTDTSGAYIFRNVPAGTYTVAATFQGREFVQQVSLPPVPSSPSDVVLNLGAVDRFIPSIVPQDSEK